MDQCRDLTPDYILCQAFFFHSRDSFEWQWYFSRTSAIRIPSEFAMRESIAAAARMPPSRNFSSVDKHRCLKQRQKETRAWTIARTKLRVRPPRLPCRDRFDAAREPCRTSTVPAWASVQRPFAAIHAAFLCAHRTSSEARCGLRQRCRP